MKVSLKSAVVTQFVAISDAEANFTRIMNIAVDMVAAIETRDKDDALPALLFTATALDAMRAHLSLLRASLALDEKAEKARMALDRWEMTKPESI